MDLFAKRYEEGYDLFDDRYNLWLQKYHPAYEVCKALFEEESVVAGSKQFTLRKQLAGRSLPLVGRYQQVAE